MRKFIPFIILVCAFSFLGFIRWSSTPEMRLLVIANEYQFYEQFKHAELDSNFLDGSALVPKWTIPLCVQMADPTEYDHIQTDSLFYSAANPEHSMHGDQLYKLYVKDMIAYANYESGQPIGQVLVKETWNVEAVPSYKHEELGAVQSMKDSLWYRPSTLSKLFIMYKEEPSEKNDEGWVYGIVDIENGRAPQLLEQGKISSCIACHKNTKYDHIFGAK